MPSALTAAAAGIASALLFACAAGAADRALLVGVNRYPFLVEDGAKADRDLSAPVHDAGRFKEFLVQRLGFDEAGIRMLTDEAATREGVLAQFRSWLIEGTGKGERAFFYFSGHGVNEVDDNADETDGLDEMLVPHDAAGDLKGELKNLIRDDEIEALLKELDGRVVTVVSDSCFSGTISKAASTAKRSGRVKSLKPFGPANLEVSAARAKANKTETKLLRVVPDNPPADAAGSYAVWTAASAAQLAYEDVQGSVFTLAFLDGVNGKADANGDGQVTASELHEFVVKASESYCKTNAECQKFGLVPQLEAPADYLRLPLTAPLFTPTLKPQPQTAQAGKPQPQTGLPGKPQPTVPEKAQPAPYQEPETLLPYQVAESVFAHQNDFALSVKMIEGGRLKFGREYRIEVASQAPGYLVLFDQSAGGKLRQVFPNKFSEKTSPRGIIRAGRLRVPDPTHDFAFEADERGPALLMALVLSETADLSGVVTATENFDVLGQPEKFLAALAQRIRSPAVNADLNRPNGRHQWAYATFAYTVE